MTDRWETASVAELARAIRDGATSSAELAEAAIANHEARDAALAAYKTWEPDRFRAEARVADDALAAGIDLGPLQGIPVSVKDLFGVRGDPPFASNLRTFSSTCSISSSVVGGRFSDSSTSALGPTSGMLC